MRRVTIIDVAKAAGVSRQTVSRAMNGKGEISPATKERVMTAVRELGYQPNRMAQSMVTRRTYSVGLVFPDILNPFFPEVARGVQDIARERTYNVFLCNSDDNPKIEANILRSLAAQPVDGIIILGSSLSDVELKAFADDFRPIVVTNRFVEHPNINRLIVDNIRGGALAAEHLIERNHTAVGILANQNFPYSQTRRVQGFRDILATNGLTSDDSIIEAAQPTIAGGYAAMQTLLTRLPHLSAVFTYNDLMGLGAIRACHDMGKRIPDDIAIIGFDDIHLTSISTPTLTSVRVDKYAIGIKTMSCLLDMLANPNQAFPQLELPVELIIRDST